jgi:hypothetical protein
MHAIANELNEVLDKVDSQTAKLLEQTVRDTLALAGERTAGEHDEMGYPKAYFTSTSGSFSAEPLERPASLSMDEREDW